MRHVTAYFSLFSFLAMMVLSTQHSHCQVITEIDGTTIMKTNSTSGLPHLKLIEDDFSSGGSTRMEFRHSENASDKFELRTFLHSARDHELRWYYNSSAILNYNVDEGGLGIGNATNPINGKLHLRATSTSSFPTLFLEEEAAAGYTRLFFANTTSSDRWSLASQVGSGADNNIGFFYNGAARLVYNEVSGGLGLGTAVPDQLLHLKFSGFNGLKIDGDGSGDARIWINNDAGNHFIFDDDSDVNSLAISSANDFKILTGSAERIRIAETGEIGINNTTLASREVRGFTDDHTYGIEFENFNTATAIGVAGEVQSNGTSNKYALFGNATGNSGTGLLAGIFALASTSASNSAAVYANGDICYTGVLHSVSDQRLKTNIQDVQPVLNKVLQLKAKKYSFKHESYPQANLAQGIQIGFLAQEVEQVFPNLVKASVIPGEIDEDGNQAENTDILSMKYIELIPILTQAIQEQQQLIINMQSEIDALKSTNK